MSEPVIAAVAIGSNLGDRESHVQFAIGRLAEILTNSRSSSMRETEPFDVPPQRAFLNAVVVGEAICSADELLHALMTIEQDCGRERPFFGAPGTLDLDLILFGETVIRSHDLTVPHPRFRQRRFVLEPLAEVAPDLRDPVTGKTVGELLAEL